MNMIIFMLKHNYEHHHLHHDGDDVYDAIHDDDDDDKHHHNNKNVSFQCDHNDSDHPHHLYYNH